jgi:hypothetical protein
MILYVYRTVLEHHLAPWQGTILRGFFPAGGGRIDEVIGRARATLRPAPERLADHECVVVDAEDDQASHTVWFAPELGCGIVKMVRVQQGERLRRRLEREAHLRHGVTAPPKEAPVRVVQTLDHVRFERFDSNWIPVSGTYTEEVFYREGTPSVLVRTITRERIKLNPQIAGVSFAPEVPDGTPVQFIGGRGGLPWEWRAGGIVPREDVQMTTKLDALVGGHRFVTPGEGGRIRLLFGPALFAAAVGAGAGAVWFWTRRKPAA